MVSASPFRRWLPLILVGAGAALLWATRPRLEPIVAPNEAQSESCLNNLRQIARAYALYGRDFDGKIPLAVDPEDRFNSQIWTSQTTDGTPFEGYLQSAPFVHVALRPYVDSPEVFHCPADRGWKISRLSQTDPRTGQPTGLPSVQPSSFVKYGTSYYSWTIYGFELRTAADIEDPAHKVVLFDGDLWHGRKDHERMGALFIDGHVEFLTKAQHQAFGPPN